MNLINNGMTFPFGEIPYELVGVQINRVKNEVITSIIKNLLSINARDLKSLTNAGCVLPNQEKLLVSEYRDFNYCIPLKILLGFA